ncbi:hypothetical protein AUP42_04025 [Thalassospira lucentensis]|uniref:Uncharacterized protein n=1 Tax=Thalassospira lucentensis TaxID=168935 RepID=A0A154L3X1_9PROT|nr:hypothetical protein [Thalassospira lucentensis]KZB62133.1 hypothetical protein AUP42_04025 [Thalassospira lucentensis]
MNARGAVAQPLLQDVNCSVEGVVSLAAFAASVAGVENSHVKIDCSIASRIDGNMAAALGGVVALLQSRGNIVDFVRLNDPVRRVLQRNGFLQPKLVDRQGTSIPFTRFTLNESKKFAGFVEDNLKGKGIPNMTDLLRRTFLQGINEIYNNCGLHSKSALGVFACGQASPKVRQALEFAVVDMGQGFRHNVSQFLGRDIEASQAIGWAMEDENTTRAGDIPGGLGLKIVREFIMHNNGSLTITSHDGYWCQNGHEITRRQLPKPFPGTMVNIKINTADRRDYMLSEELDPNDFL